MIKNQTSDQFLAASPSGYVMEVPMSFLTKDLFFEKYKSHHSDGYADQIRPAESFNDPCVICSDGHLFNV